MNKMQSVFIESKQEMMGYIMDHLQNMGYVDLEMVYGLVLGLAGDRKEATQCPM